MSQQLGTLEELPQDYRDDMAAAGVAPLWNIHGARRCHAAVDQHRTAEQG